MEELPRCPWSWRPACLFQESLRARIQYGDPLRSENHYVHVSNTETLCALRILTRAYPNTETPLRSKNHYVHVFNTGTEGRTQFTVIFASYGVASDLGARLLDTCT